MGAPARNPAEADIPDLRVGALLLRGLPQLREEALRQPGDHVGGDVLTL